MTHADADPLDSRPPAGPRCCRRSLAAGCATVRAASGDVAGAHAVPDPGPAPIACSPTRPCRPTRRRSATSNRWNARWRRPWASGSRPVGPDRGLHPRQPRVVPPLPHVLLPRAAHPPRLLPGAGQPPGRLHLSGRRGSKRTSGTRPRTPCSTPRSPDLPLWLDEGLAEYFEVDEERQGLNAEHLGRCPTTSRRALRPTCGVWKR